MTETNSISLTLDSFQTSTLTSNYRLYSTTYFNGFAVISDGTNHYYSAKAATNNGSHAITAVEGTYPYT
jgi:hypothetical protein